MILKEENAFNEKRDLLTNFIVDVKQDCLMNANFFNFLQVPECVMKKNFTRKQFEIVSKLLLSVKESYLKERAEKDAEIAEQARKEAEAFATKDKKKGNEEAAPVRADPNMITEEDLIDIELLDNYIANIEHKFTTKKELWETFIESCKQKGQAKCTELNVDAPKTKSQISQAVFASELNTHLEKNHDDVTTVFFKNQLFASAFTDSQKKKEMQS